MYPTVHLEMSTEEAAGKITGALASCGFRVVRSFDLQEAAAAHSHCACPNHGTENCTCQYLMLMAYPQGAGNRGNPLTIAVHSHEGATFVSLLAGEETEWLSAMLPALAGTSTLPNKLEEKMSSKTVTVPNISCGHCTHTIQMELGEMPGVTSVSAEVASRQVSIEWEDPATWDKIEATLVEINYPPVD